MPLIGHTELRALGAALIARCGSAPAEAALVADHLVEANLAGHDSHGVGLLPTYVDLAARGLVSPNTRGRLVREAAGLLVYDGERGYGQRVAGEAMRLAIDRCAGDGMSLLALRNASHIGRVGAYAEQAAAAGLVSLHFVNVTDHAPSVAPYGGREARLATNPFCVAIPGRGGRPVVLLDMATARMSFGKVRVAYNAGQTLPGGVLLDAAGEPSDDPAALLGTARGSLLPFGEHKGSGLGLVCELLAGALAGGGTVQPGNPRRGGIVNNMLAILIDPGRLAERAWLAQEIDALLAYLKSSAPRRAGAPVQVAGEPEQCSRSERSRDGVALDARTWEEILAAAERVGLDRAAVLALAGLS